MDASGEAARVSEIIAFGDLILAKLGKTIDKVLSFVGALYPEVVSKVDDFAPLRDVVGGDELPRESMPEAKEYNIRGLTLFKGRGAYQVSIPEKVSMDGVNSCSCRCGAQNRYHLCVGVIEQKPQKLPSGITCTTGNRHFYLIHCLYCLVESRKFSMDWPKLW